MASLILFFSFLNGMQKYYAVAGNGKGYQDIQEYTLYKSDTHSVEKKQRRQCQQSTLRDIFVPGVVWLTFLAFFIRLLKTPLQMPLAKMVRGLVDTFLHFPNNFNSF